MFVPHRKHLWPSTACYGDSFAFLHVDYVRTSQEAQLWASTACYGDSFAFLHVDDDRTSQEAQPVTGIALLFYYLYHYTFHIFAFQGSKNVSLLGARFDSQIGVIA
jgi:hypothetical protein